MSSKILKGNTSGGNLMPSPRSHIRQFSPGGYLVGPSHDGGGIGAIIDDEEPIEVEGGEFIIRKSSVDLYGLNFLHRLNQAQVDQSVSNMKRGGKVRRARRRR